MVEAKVKSSDVEMVRAFEETVGVDQLINENKLAQIVGEESAQPQVHATGHHHSAPVDEIIHTPVPEEEHQTTSTEGTQDPHLAWKIENAKRLMQYMGTYPENSKISHDDEGWDEAERLMDLALRAKKDRFRRRRERTEEGEDQEEEVQEVQEEEEEEGDTVLETLEGYMKKTKDFAQARAVQIGEKIGEKMGIIDHHHSPEEEEEEETIQRKKEPRRQQKQQKEQREHEEEEEKHPGIMQQTVGAVKEFITGFVETVAHGGTDSSDESK